MTERPTANVTRESFRDLRVAPMGQDAAESVAGWHYQGAYRFYDFAADPDDLDEILCAESRAGRYFRADLPSGGLVGFIEMSVSADSGTEIGLGLRPDLTGHGLGETYVRAVCAWCAKNSASDPLVMKVAEFNQRAIKVYERAGFRTVGRETVATNGDLVPFVVLSAPRDHFLRLSNGR